MTVPSEGDTKKLCSDAETWTDDAEDALPDSPTRLHSRTLDAGTPGSTRRCSGAGQSTDDWRNARDDEFPDVDPMREIMDGAHLPACPPYIFKAHEMTQEVRGLLKHCPDTDVVLVGKDGELAAHTVVLTAKGGALAEKVTGMEVDAKVPLADLTVDEIREILRYVYTGTAPAAARIPHQLLVAAHNFDLPGLKDRCGEELVSRLTIENVVDMFDLADTHKEERLKLASAVLFLENSKEVYDSEGWHRALDRRPASAMRLVQIAVAKGNMSLSNTRASSRIVHLIARLYMAAIVPVIGYLIYATVKARKLQDGADNSTSTDLL